MHLCGRYHIIEVSAKQVVAKRVSDHDQIIMPSNLSSSHTVEEKAQQREESMLLSQQQQGEKGTKKEVSHLFKSPSNLSSSQEVEQTPKEEESMLLSPQEKGEQGKMKEVGQLFKSPSILSSPKKVVKGQEEESILQNLSQTRRIYQKICENAKEPEMNDIQALQIKMSAYLFF